MRNGIPIPFYKSKFFHYTGQAKFEHDSGAVAGKVNAAFSEGGLLPLHVSHAMILLDGRHYGVWKLPRFLTVSSA